MADASKHHLLLSDLKSLFSIVRTRRIKLFAYGFMLSFIACTVFIAFNPNGSSSPWYNRIFTTSSPNAYNSQLSSFFSFFFPDDRNSSTKSFDESERFPGNEVVSESGKGVSGKRSGDRDSSFTIPAPKGEEVSVARSYNVSSPFPGKKAISDSEKAITGESGVKRNGSFPIPAPKVEERSFNVSAPFPEKKANPESKSAISGKSSENRTENSSKEIVAAGSFNASSRFHRKNETSVANKAIPGKNTENRNTSASFSAPKKEDSVPDPGTKLRNATISSRTSGENRLNATSSAKLKEKGVSNYTASLLKRNGTGAVSENRTNGSLERSKNQGKGEKKTMVGLENCNIFEGRWVRDDSYPLYKEGSCPHIDEPFNCFLNGRPDRNYQKLRWQPNSCNIPR